MAGTPACGDHSRRSRPGNPHRSDLRALRFILAVASVSDTRSRLALG